MPHSVPKDEDWLEMAANVVVLDRIRMALLLKQAGDPPAQYTSWNAEQLAGLSERIP
jgi:hypothetical protein